MSETLQLFFLVIITPFFTVFLFHKLGTAKHSPTLGNHRSADPVCLLAPLFLSGYPSHNSNNLPFQLVLDNMRLPKKLSK